jgi:hypothetical protein
MTRVRVGITMSLDGYVAGPDQSLENPARGGAAPPSTRCFYGASSAMRAFLSRNRKSCRATARLRQR